MTSSATSPASWPGVVGVGIMAFLCLLVWVSTLVLSPTASEKLACPPHGHRPLWRGIRAAPTQALLRLCSPFSGPGVWAVAQICGVMSLRGKESGA